MHNDFEVLEILVSDCGEQNPTCSVCRKNKSVVHNKHLDIYLCQYCEADFESSD